MPANTKAERIVEANRLIEAISSYGRRFFYSPRFDRVARFEMGLDGKLWLRDEYTDQKIYVAYRGRWRNFSNGGTLRRMIEDLVDYIRTGTKIPAGHLGPWPSYLCDGDVWGYGKEEMARLRSAARSLRCIEMPACVAPAAGQSAG